MFNVECLMRKTFETYLALVRAALWNEAMPEVEMSEEMLQLIMRQGVGPLVFPRMLMTPMMMMVCV